MAFTLSFIQNGQAKFQVGYDTLEEVVQAAVRNTPSPSRIVWMPFGQFNKHDNDFKKRFLALEHIHEGEEGGLFKQARQADLAKVSDENRRKAAEQCPQSRLVLWVREEKDTNAYTYPPGLSCVVITGVPQNFHQKLPEYFPDGCNVGTHTETLITTGPFKPKSNFKTFLQNAWAGVKGFLAPLAPMFGVHSTGGRNWFLLAMLTFLGIGLLGALLPVAPLGIVITLKLASFFFLGASLLVASLTLSSHYEQVSKLKQYSDNGFSPITYVKHVTGEWLGKSWRNWAQFLGGLVLFLGFTTVFSFFFFPSIATLLPGLNPLLDGLTTLVMFLGQGFNATMVSLPPFVVVAIFGVAILTGYDVLCRVIKWLVPIEDPAESFVEDEPGEKRVSQVENKEELKTQANQLNTKGVDAGHTNISVNDNKARGLQNT